MSFNQRRYIKNTIFAFGSLLTLFACEPETTNTNALSSGGEPNQAETTAETAGERPQTAGEMIQTAGEMSAGAETSSSKCMPAEGEWSAVRDIFTDKCGLCHGSEPQFGAPYTLTNYSDFTDEKRNQVVRVLSSGEMPPAGQPALSAEERMQLYSWLNCGEVGDTPEQLPAGGFNSTRPVLSAPEELPTNVDFFEVRAGGFQVPTQRSDRYECFTIAAPVNETRFIRRIETVVDDARVLHHVVVIPESGDREPGTHSQCDQDNAFALIYGWAPGQGALHFEEGGIKLEPGQALTLQIHYNNSARYEDAVDNSGVRIYHGPVEGPEVAVLTLGPVGFEVAPRSREQVTGYCELPKDTKLIASFPHMHEMGASFEQVVTRDWLGQSIDEEPVWEDIITLDGWDFESQYVYDSPMELSQGDLIKTSCVYENTTDEPLRFGEKTADEMCFNFAYISPPIGVNLCSQSSEPSRTYNAGSCAPGESVGWQPPPVEVRFQASTQREASESNLLSTGLYWIDEAVISVPNDAIEQYRFDLEQSGARGRGAVLWGEDQQLTVDLNSEMRLVALGLSFTENFNLSFQTALNPYSAIDENDPAQGSFALDVSCGSFDQERMWITPDQEVDSTGKTLGGWLEFPVSFGPFDLVIRAHVRRTETD